MKHQVTCPIDKVKQLILESAPNYYKCTMPTQKSIISQYVKLADIDNVFDYMSIKKITSDEAKEIIATREPLGKFYLIENGLYVGLDNSYGNAWTEDFKDLDSCLTWLLDEYYDKEFFQC